MRKHIRSLYSLISTLKTHSIQGAEIGVWKGEMSHGLLSSDIRLFLYMVDNYHPTDKLKDVFDDTSEALRMAWSRTEFASHRRCMIIRDSVVAATMFGTHELDFVFIDADHRYEYVRDDINAWARVVRPGGIVAGHDYNGPNDRRGVFGVKKAVDEHAENVGVAVEVLPGRVWHYRKPLLDG